jgi:hypothetical protein
LFANKVNREIAHSPIFRESKLPTVQTIRALSVARPWGESMRRKLEVS